MNQLFEPNEKETTLPDLSALTAKQKEIFLLIKAATERGEAIPRYPKRGLDYGYRPICSINVINSLIQKWFIKKSKEMFHCFEKHTYLSNY
jgi:hypothetical protein